MSIIFCFFYSELPYKILVFLAIQYNCGRRGEQRRREAAAAADGDTAEQPQQVQTCQSSLFQLSLYTK